MRSIGRRMKKMALQVLDLPKDALLDLPRVTFIGGMQVYVENFHSVAEFSDKQMRLQLSKGQIVLQGKQLEIKKIVGDHVMIEGNINTVQFVP